ncbi:hypothetical protein I307_04268 [Cryptococcus deuterogattii 99/473]|uniref:Major facilitator superfamily (MFS) profile domain-containing protein n=1 Tax=Cryptococcus deuterogattii Ram5 TaxID=1296110 RepID=A0A0D0U4M9_9TREE|nr:hypothetical protein I313_01341 [Cryptococcus deuterogattii Ram5]KIY56465.1 hypothetical protein I307_04268 [Cryptococcus deuterogattii 99/473]
MSSSSFGAIMTSSSYTTFSPPALSRSSSSKALDSSLPTEDTPLLPLNKFPRSWFPPVTRVLFTSFLLAMTFAFTQTSLIYAFRIMTCDEYYKTHDEWTGTGDRCSVPKIEADSASQIALMSTVTTSCTIANLFITGWFIKKCGCKAAMFQQTFWAALRNLTQMYALSIGGNTGMQIIQTTQLFNVLGSGGGYQIASNVFISTLVAAEERTSQFGVLTGVIMLGSSSGYTFGGLAYNWFGLLAPFQCAFALLCFCTVFGFLFLPHIPPENDQLINDKEKKTKSFLAPLKIFVPTRNVIVGNKTKHDYNLLLLACGAFFSVLATGYVHMGLQLVGTDKFGFQPGESGIMQSLNLLVKAFFLSICFPRIIAAGRRYVSDRQDVPSFAAIEHPENPYQAEEPDDIGAPRQEQAQAPTDAKHGSVFDLYFLRWSIFTDGVLTALTTLSTKGWHLYVAACVLPFASGTGSACKGVVLDFVDSEERADALSAIALVEKIAQVSTISVFGYVFAWLSEEGKPTLVFLVNGLTAIIAFFFLLFVSMPRPGEGKVSLP